MAREELTPNRVFRLWIKEECRDKICEAKMSTKN
jgi:hypothetical protein